MTREAEAREPGNQVVTFTSHLATFYERKINITEIRNTGELTFIPGSTSFASSKQEN